MDRFKKRVEEFRLKVRKFVQYNWHNDPEGDVFRSLDILYMLGGMRYKPTQRWQRICWNTYRFVPVFSFSILILNLIDAMTAEFDLLMATWHFTTVSAIVLCFAKEYILEHHFESIQTVRTFINSKPSGSGDMKNDAAFRKKFFQRLQLMGLALLFVLVMDLIIINLPNSGMDKMLGTPQLVRQLGSLLAVGVHLLFTITAIPVWLNKYVSGTGTVCVLLYGFKTEYEMFVRGFGKNMDNVYSDIEDKLPSTFKATPDWKRNRRDQLYWKHLKQHVNRQVEQHVQLVENLQLLQPIVKHLFAIIYYNAMVLFSPLIYVGLFNGFSLASLYLTSGIALNLLECYSWCRIIDALKDLNEILELEILNLLTKMPHSETHHKEYVEMRTTLCIMKTFVRNNEPFSCGGVFPISVEAFADLLNIGYTVVTFLMDCGKNDWKETFLFNK